MAEHILKQLLKQEKINGINVSSAGTAAFPHYRIYGALKKIMDEEKMDVSSHVATQVTEKMIEDADMIFVMKRPHRDVITGMVPSAAERTFLLKQFATGNGDDADIPDPIGQPEEVYRRVMEELKEYIKRITAKIKGG